MLAANPSEHFFNGLGMHKLLLIGWWPEVVKCGQLQRSGWRKTQALAFQAEPRSHPVLGLAFGGQVGGLSPIRCTMWTTCLSLSARESCYLNRIGHWANFYFNFWVRNSRKIQLFKKLFSILHYLSLFLRKITVSIRNIWMCELRSSKPTTITKHLTSIWSDIQITPLCVHCWWPLASTLMHKAHFQLIKKAGFSLTYRIVLPLERVGFTVFTEMSKPKPPVTFPLYLILTLSGEREKSLKEGQSFLLEELSYCG